jgi:hypothetical protein
MPGRVLRSVGFYRGALDCITHEAETSLQGGDPQRICDGGDSRQD